MRTIFRLVRWFGRALERDGIGRAGFWGSVAVAFLFGALLNCGDAAMRELSGGMELDRFRREAVRRGEMEAWRTPDGEYVYRWKESPEKPR